MIELILADLKTEAPQAAARRRAEQTLYGYPHPYRYEHLLQVTAQAMVIEELMGIPLIHQGRILYMNKVNFQVDQVPVELSGHARGQVLRMVKAHEQRFAHFQRTGELPPRLAAADEVWRCQPRSETDERGKWCSCRSYCMSLPEKPSKGC